MCGTEGAELFAHLGLHAVCLWIEIRLALAEKPVHAVTHIRGHIQVFEKSEIRQFYRKIMSHAILELVNKARFSELRGLEIDLVLDGCVVTQGEFLVETLFPDPVLDLERIECGDRESDVRQCECV